MKELRRINTYFKKYRGRLVLGFIITIIATAFKLVVPMKIGDSVNFIKDYLDGNISEEIMKAGLQEGILIPL
jgi:ATP-binding cassette subfamily B multidrug efflux pump